VQRAKSLLSRASLRTLAILTVLGPKLLTVLIKFVKVAKVGKAALLGSSLAVYSYLVSWQFAVLMLAMLATHEYGHVWAMKRCGMKVRGMYFVPLFGAIAVTDDLFKSRRDECYIAIMGPLWGLGVTVLTYGVYVVSDHPFYAAMTCWMAVVNIFNLLPILPLDGGRVVRSIGLSANTRLGVWMVSLGLIFGATVAFVDGLVLLGTFTIVGLMDLRFDLRRQKEARKAQELLKLVEAWRTNLKKTVEDLPDHVTVVVPGNYPHEETITDVRVVIEQDSDGKTVETEYSIWKDGALDQESVDLGPLREIAKSYLEPMTRAQVAGYTLFCLSVFVALYIVMKLSGIVPGSDVAMQLLKS
jgi:Zn-dependent protease